jgi:dimethylhistidine N-methyltransferase
MTSTPAAQALASRHQDGARATLIELPVADAFAEAVAAGLRRTPRALPPRYFYDAEGSALFERITELPEYYLTRTEAIILAGAAPECPAVGTLVELGCGSAVKTRLLLDALFRRRDALTYVPVDISGTALRSAVPDLLRRYPGLHVCGIRGEYEQALGVLPRGGALVLLLGSNIGNLDPADACALLARLRGHHVLVGFDMQKPAELLHAAYNDAQGLTAGFNLNLLARINRELGGGFALDRFEHRAFYNAAAGRVEMHLRSSQCQAVRIDALGMTFAFAQGETIHTENSYKFTRAHIHALAAAAGFRLERVWTDDAGWFSVALLG